MEGVGEEVGEDGPTCGASAGAAGDDEVCACTGYARQARQVSTIGNRAEEGVVVENPKIGSAYRETGLPRANARHAM